MRRRRELFVALFAAFTLNGGGLLAQETSPSLEMKPLWEAGVFGAVGRLPHYRGSDEYNVYVLPLPFLIYRGEVLNADRDGVRGIFYKSERIETDISMSGNPPVDRNDSARQGMPELNPLVEVGPAVKYYLYRGEPAPSLYLQAAIREVTAVDVSNWGVSYEGLRGGPSLNFTGYEPVPNGPWSFGLSAGVDFTSSRYNRYFYDVTEEQVQPGRGVYHSDGGYAGFSLSAYALRTFTPRFSWGLYARWDNIDGAVYEDSPLVKDRNNYVLGTALIWTIQQSKQYVHARE